jgi:hypothetical protein
MYIFILELLLFFTLSLFSGIVLGRWIKGMLYHTDNIDGITTNTKLMDRLQKKGLFRYGEIIPDLELNGKQATYEVVNEKSVRVQAGIMAVLAICALSSSQLFHYWLPIKIIITLFFIDFFTKVIIGIKFSIFYNISNWFVRKREPEYVGAVQKRFAWSIGLILATIMIYLQYVAESKGIITISLCTLCIIFMTLECLFGLCIGCKMYYTLISFDLIKKPEIAPACPGGVCPIPQNP